MGESRGRTFRKTWRWIQLSRQMRTVLPPWCTYPACDCPTGRTIDLTLPPRTRWSWTLDHRHELQDGGDPYDPANLTAAHWRCNARKGAARQAARKQETFRMRARTIEARTLQCLNPSREW